jgi:hypothetical protein
MPQRRDTGTRLGFAVNERVWGRGELAGARTQDQRLKRAMLYQLSYELTEVTQSKVSQEGGREAAAGQVANCIMKV